MIGKVLGYDKATGEGVITSENGERYSFKKENWKESNPPKKDMTVDFVASEDRAEDIYISKDIKEENSKTLLALVAVAITFFFGFIGTFVSRVFIANENIDRVILPTVIHFLITFLVVIPFIGWILYLIGNLYYMYQNYQAVMLKNS